MTRSTYRRVLVAMPVVGDDPVQTAQIYAKGSGIVCGLLLADETIKQIDPEARID